MKILIVSPTFYEYPQRLGGAETFVREIARALAKCPQVHKVGVLSFSRKGPYDTQEEGVSYFVNKAYLMRGNPSNPWPIFNFFELRHWDIIYLQQYHTWLTCVVTILAKMFGKMVILTDHNGGGATFNRRLRIDKKIDIFLAISMLAQKEINLSPKRTSYVYGGVELNKFHPPEGQDDRDGVLFVGRAHPIKGIIPFLKSAIAVQFNGKITLALAVASENKEHFREIKDYLASCGATNVNIILDAPIERIVAEYGKHRWTVLPSINQRPHECLGLTALESLDCDTPVAISPFTGIYEIINNAGPFVHVLTDHQRFFKEMANKGHVKGARQWALKNASWEKVAQRVLAEINSSGGRIS